MTQYPGNQSQAAYAFGNNVTGGPYASNFPTPRTSYQEQFVNYFEKPPMIQVEPVIGNSNEYETPVNLQAVGEEVINSPTNAINTPLLPVYEEDNVEDHEVAQINEDEYANEETWREHTTDDAKTVLSARKRADVKSVIS